MMKWESSKDSTGEEGIDLFNTFPKVIKITIFSLTLIILLLFLIPVNVLLASDFRTEEYLKSWKIKDGESFTVYYTHSVQLCPVSETYLINEDEIILTETYFESYGAGLPSTTSYKFEITSTGFRIYEINEIMEDLIYRTGAVRANHALLLRNINYNFLDFSKPREGVRLEIKKINALKYFIKEAF